MKQLDKISLTLPNYPITRRQILDSSKLKEFADDNFKFDENGSKLSKRVENTVGKVEKLLVTSNFSFSHSVFKRLVSQGCQKVSLCGNGLTSKVLFELTIWVPKPRIVEHSNSMFYIANRQFLAPLVKSQQAFFLTLYSSFVSLCVLSHYQKTNFRLFQTEIVCRRQFQIRRKWKKVIQTGRKHCRKRRNCSLPAISSFPTVFSKGLFSRGVKVSLCGNGLTSIQKHVSKPPKYSVYETSHI